MRTVLTDRGTHFTTPSNSRSAAPLIKRAIAKGELFRAHSFEYACAIHNIDHRLTKPYHPWTNGRAERMNRTAKDATIKAFHYPGLDALNAHVLAFLRAHNFAKHLKALRWRTPVHAICDA